MEEILKKSQIVGEQPLTESSTLNAGEQPIIKETSSGSPIPKFKSVDALKDAYENLEKEFTQKCQKVKDLSDKLQIQDNVINTPEYKKDGWEEKVANFFSSYPESKDYAVEISNVLSNDDKIACGENSLQGALTKVLADKYVPYSALIKDENFLNNYVYSNSQISDKIIDNYLQKLEDKKTMPLVSSGSGSGTFASPVSRPKTLE